MNMLGMLLRAEDDPEVEFSRTQIRDEVTTLLIAGHETTALSISYTLSLLSWHPEIRRAVRAEAREVLGDDPPAYGDVDDLDLTQRAYREALRLYPPAWAVFRRTTGDVRLGDYGIESGAAVITPQWSIHRDPRYFEEPTRFDPDRWARHRPGEVPAYFPFSSGPHACIGKQFALSGATLVLARLVRDFEIEVAQSALDDLMITPTLRPAGGIDATVTPVD
jgi:cytochrome P450